MEGYDGETRSSTAAHSPAPFLSKTYDMVDDRATDAVVTWSRNGASFVVVNVPEFCTHLLPKYFKHNNFSSFVRQLNTYGFRKIDSERWEFANEGFLRGKKHLLKGISRRKAGHVQNNQQVPQIQNTSAGEPEKVGIDKEVEVLKNDKNVLMQELVRLRQQQQGTDNQLQTVVQRVHLMEQRQQQMMSFLAKAMQRPGVLAQLVEEQNESNRLISGVSKKRRLPKQDEENYGANHVTLSPNGQSVRYKSLMNEAAQSMLRQILKMNTSSRLEPTIKNANGFLIENVPSPSNVLDADSSSRRMSGVTLSEVLPASSQFCAGSGFAVSQSSAAIHKAQASSDVPTGMTHFPATSDVPTGMTNFPATSEPIPRGHGIVPNFHCIPGVMPESTAVVPDIGFKGPTNEDTDLLSGFVDDETPGAVDEFSSDPEVDFLLDEVPKLPGINDKFWEQFLSASPDTNEILSRTLDFGPSEEHEQESGWDRTKHMNHLTEQMGLLASGSSMG